MAHLSVLRFTTAERASMTKLEEVLNGFEPILPVITQRCFCVLQRRTALDKAEMFIGRHPRELGIDFTLPSTTVNRRHARIREQQGSHWIEDLNSRNGTRLNADWVKQTPVMLVHHDEIRIGEYLMRFHADEPAAHIVSAGSDSFPRQLAFDPRWRTSDVTALAQGIDQEKAYHRLGILADALREAGCANERILTQCRFHGPYEAGCWVVDLILERI